MDAEIAGRRRRSLLESLSLSLPFSRLLGLGLLAWLSGCATVAEFDGSVDARADREVARDSSTGASPDAGHRTDAGRPVDGGRDGGKDVLIADEVAAHMDTGSDVSVGEADVLPRSDAAAKDSAPATDARDSGSPVATFDCTGASQSFTVPLGVVSLNVKAWGAGGGGVDTTSPGGGGGYVEAIFSVSPGEVLSIDVGCPGQGTGENSATTATGGWGYATGGPSPGDGWHGGGGGGASAVSTPQSLLLVAGGGGGGGGAISNAPGGGGGGTAGGAGGTCGTPTSMTGGQGGQPGNTGGAGGAGTSGGLSGSAGTTTSGGAGGQGPSPNDGLGGGGGGGQMGGGGGGAGGACLGGGGGGGGSSYVANPQPTRENGVGAVPGNAADSDLPSGYAVGGVPGSVPAGNGYVVLRW